MPEQELLPDGEGTRAFTLFDLGFLDGIAAEPQHELYRYERAYRAGWYKGVEA